MRHAKATALAHDPDCPCIENRPGYALGESEHENQKNKNSPVEKSMGLIYL